MQGVVMITLALIGGASLASTVGLGGLVLLRRRGREVPIPDDVVFMEEAVLQDFLHNEYVRSVEAADTAADEATAKAERAVSAVKGQAAAASELAAEGGERVIPSLAGGATAVAGPPTDLADEGWARDPQGCHEWRYFDSAGWSDFVLDGDNVDTDPLPSASIHV